MTTIIEVQLKNVYGTDRIYPINDLAIKITALLNRKTLTKADLAAIKDMGFTIKWITNPPDETF